MNNKTGNSVKLTKIIKEFNLEGLYLPDNIEDILITRSEVNRPGLPLTGFFDYFTPERIQIIGRVESIFLSQLSDTERYDRLYQLFEKKPVCIILARGIEPPVEMLEVAKIFDVPILRTPVATTDFVASLIASLNIHLAPTITRHGVLVEVYGEGILILGDSGIGKSETAIELIKRGHRLIADDAVEISRVSEKTLVGRAPSIIRHYMELRGIGIIDVRRIFGVGAVKETEKIQLVIKFEPWVEGKLYDRMGLENETVEILGINIPAITVPVRPGRNLAVILEIAAMNQRLKKMGYNTAEEFNKKLEEEFLNNNK
ncbi:MAG: HPr(Ser) kinase/phosphatase [Clostridia bacterium]|nr:HPr(Ser) kinase/phosphatase [Clostridia bacterium]MBO5440655.1 HPr(Ser) kinase/phosphatase [Clostridia bacterium]